MDKHTKAFIEFVEEVSEKEGDKSEYSILNKAIRKSKFYFAQKDNADSCWETPRKLLAAYKDDLIHRWGFLLETGDRFDIKKVKFWDVMDYFSKLSTEDKKKVS